ncbi:pilus assembly PilX family protein [Marinobacterium litorale]|uniref:pilus assembly PilX family protein n=1 Tax=Marinobacterium litorale TaxID=404770 RepID=UPI0004097FF4|nr:hypothetical protein [Marinobacterium litorale]
MINSTHSPRREKGAVTLFMAVIVLALITIVAFYTTRTVLFETKVQANNLRAKQAFEASEAAHSYVLNVLNDTADNKEQLADIDLNDDCYRSVNGEDWYDLKCRANVLGWPDFTYSANVRLDTVTVSGGSDEVDRVNIIGFSEDTRAKHYIFQTLVQERPLPNAPLTPITAKGGFIVQGSATVYNPEGVSTIWSGGDVDLTQNASSSTFVADPSYNVNAADGYPACLDESMTCHMVTTSTQIAAGPDIIEFDNNLKNLSDEELFEHFFGFPMDEYVDRFATIELDVDAGDEVSSINNATGEVVYIDAGSGIDIGSSDLKTVGCSYDITGVNADNNGGYLPSETCADSPLKPTIVIIDGDVSFKGLPVFYGILFVKGELSGNGTPAVEGAMIMTGASGSTGSVDVWYNSNMLQALNDQGDFFGLSGGWRDWAN